MPTKAWYVNVTGSDINNFTVDKTANQIVEAFAHDFSVFCDIQITSLFYGLSIILPLYCIDGISAIAFGGTCTPHVGGDPSSCSITLTYDGNWHLFVEEVINENTVPTSLKNPNALTIKIGDTTTTYDGSSDVTIELPDGTEVSY